jgi:hypothetical protein
MAAVADTEARRTADGTTLIPRTPISTLTAAADVAREAGDG